MALPKETTLKNFILDVDGVLTTGQFLYTTEGKYAKIFGPHDNDGIKLLRPYLSISAISADKRGWEITRKRVAEDMNLALTFVSETDRLAWFKSTCNLLETVYMGDGIYDAAIFEHVAYSIAPANAFYVARNKANFVTNTASGQGAVAEACLHIIEKFFNQKTI
jgi:3-deoxy-D-manno-octulosonate 8-phosphate phosphatase (KDO 8-P phosphatase)